ncbi:MAG: GatB/YqeY domain-containing protein [Actinobacteria bacterium]|nr:GatB/YqeY domain-containing protein [Actinomycetota bacterium]
MTSLKNTLQTDLTVAMRAGDAESVRTIRMVLTAITQAEVSGKAAHELTHDDEVAILSTELKRRRESAEAFSDAGRPELAEAELAEADVIARYLPQPLTEAELAALVAAAVDQAEAEGLQGGRAMGAVMKALKPQTAGRCDGAVLAGMVKQALGLG